VNTRTIPTASLALFLAPLLLSAQDGDPLPDPDPEITAAELEHHVRFLASDELRGREAGTPDAVRAARYLARALEQAGCRPAGDDGTFLQAVPLEQWVHEQAPELVVTTSDGSELSGTYGVDFETYVRGTPRSTGVIEVLPVSGPNDLPAEVSSELALFLDGPRRQTFGWLGERGLSFEGWGLFLRADPSGPGEPSAGPRSGIGPAGGDAADGVDYLTLKGDLAGKLLASEIATVELTFHARRVAIDDYNVIGRIDGVGTGEHPELARETIVYSAHYDHIGTRPADGDADTVFNGADDDASGTAAVLELAQAFAADEPPARTLLFLLASGEEKGLIGTRYYLDHPSVPLDQTVANLNFEMIGRPDELVGPGKLWLTGFERTTLGAAFRAAGFDVVADERPEQNFFQRSDNYAFAVLGIVGQTLSSYNLHEDYHNVTDEADTLDYEHMQAATRSAYSAARLLSQGHISPEWLPGGKPEAR